MHKPRLTKLLSGVLAVLLSVLGLAVLAAPASAAAGTAYLNSGEKLYGGQSLVSYGMSLTLGTDGNLVMTDVGHAVWANGKSGHSGAYLYMQSDGNLVEYAGSTAIWSTGTNSHPGSYLSINSVGPAAVMNGYTTLWETPVPYTIFAANQQDVLWPGTSLGASGQTLYDIYGTYSFYEYEGWIELYQNGTQNLLWYAGSYCSGTSEADMQTDGNFVIYCNGQATWSSGTGGHPASYGYFLHLLDNGKLVISSNWGVTEWTS